MATRLYVTNSAPSYTPTTVRSSGITTSASMVSRALSTTKSGANAAVAQAETSTSATYRALLIRGVSEPLAAGGTTGGNITTMFARNESSTNMNAQRILHVYATVGNSDTVRGTLLATNLDATEWPTTLTGGTDTIALSAVNVQAGDRIVIEVGFQASNTSSTSMTGTMRYGGTDATDLAANTTGVTTRSPYVEFSGMDALFTAPKPKFETLTDDFSVDSRASKWPGSYGTVTIANGVATVTPGGATAYAGMQTSFNSFSLIDSYAKVKLTPQAGPYMSFTIAGGTASGGVDISVLWSQGFFSMGQRNAYAYTSNSASFAHAAGVPIWFAFAEGAGASKFGVSGVAGTTYFLSSANGTSWDVRHTVPTPSFLTSAWAGLEAGESATGSAVWDDFNIDTAQTSFSGNLTLNASRTLSLSGTAASGEQMQSSVIVRQPILTSRIDTATRTVTVGVPSTAEVGDILIYAFHSADLASGNSALPSGWTSIASGTSATRGTVRLAWRAYTEADNNANLTFEAPVIGTAAGTVSLIAVNGVDTANITAMAEAVSLGAGGGTQFSFPAKTPSVANTTSLYGGVFWHATSAVNNQGRSATINNVELFNAGVGQTGTYLGTEFTPWTTVTPTRVFTVDTASTNAMTWTIIFRPETVFQPTPGNSERYYDMTSVVSAIDAATTLTELNSAFTPVETAYNIGTNIGTTTTTVLGTRSWTNPTIDDVNLKSAAKNVMDALAKYPPEFVRHVGLHNIILVKHIVNSEAPEADIGGFVSDAQMVLDIENDTSSLTFGYLFHHEFQHVIGNNAGQYREYIEPNWTALNPSGFTYMGSAYNEAFTGDWPQGFVRNYARSSFNEDMAETWGMMMSASKQALLARMVAEDSIIAAKVTMLKQFISDVSMGRVSGADYYRYANIGDRTRLFATHGIAAFTSTDGPLNLGTRFTVDTNSTVTGGRYWKTNSANDGQTITMSLYDAGTTPIATVTRVQKATDPIGWVNVEFPANVAVVTGTTYTIGWHTTGTNYAVSTEYPQTGWDYPPLHAIANFGVYQYGAVAKPATAHGTNGYLIDVAILEKTAQTPKSVKVLDTDNIGMTQAWFNRRYAEGFRMFITSGTPWSGAVTLDQPRPETEAQLGMALTAGMKIGLYTRDPRHWSNGLASAGQYKSQLQFFALDVETDPGIPVTRAMVDGVKAQGVRPIIYAGSGSWATIQGATANSFSDVPLWDTDTEPSMNESTWTADYLSPPPVVYGGWNTSANRRVGVQQKFEVTLDGYKVDLNSFNESFTDTVSVQGSLSLTASRTLGLSGVPSFGGSLSLNASRTLTVAGSPAPAGSVTLNASRTLAVAGVPAVSGSLTLNASRTLTFAGVPAPAGALTLNASRTLSLAGIPAHAGSLTLNASRTLTQDGTPAVAGSLTLSRSCSASFSGTPAVAADLTLTIGRTLSLPGSSLFTGALNLSASSTLTVSGTPNPGGALNLSASRTLVFTGTPSATGSLAVNASRTLDVNGAPSVAGSLTVNAGRSLITNGNPSVASDLSLNRTAGVGTVGIPTAGDSLTLGTSRTLTYTSAFSIEGTLARTITRTLTQAGAPAITSTLGLTANRTLTLDAVHSQSGSLAMDRTIALTLSGEAYQQGAGSIFLSLARTLTLAGSPATSGDLALSASRNLTLSGSPSASGALALSTSRSLSGAGAPNPAAALVLNAARTLTPSGTPVTGDILSLVRSTALVLSASLATGDTLDLSMARTLTFAGAGENAGTLNLSLATELNLIGSPAVESNLILMVERTLTLDGSPSMAGQTTLNMATLFGVSGSPSFSDALALSTTRSITSGGAPNPTGNLPLSGSRLLTLVAQAVQVAGTLNLTGTRSLVLTGVAAAEGQGSINLLHSRTLTLSGTPIINSTISRNLSRALTVAGQPKIAGTLPLTGDTTLGLAGSPSHAGTLLLERQGTLTVAGTPALVGTLDLTTAGQWTLDGTPLVDGSLILGGEGVLTLSGIAGPASGVKMLMKDGTELHAFILVGGILVPVTPNFMES